MKLLWVVNQAVVSLRGMGVIRICTTYVYTGLWERRNKRLTTYKEVVEVALFYMPNSNRFNILSISIFSEISLSIYIYIYIYIDIFQNLVIDIDIFQNSPIDIDIFQKCRYIDNRYSISIYRTGLAASDGGAADVSVANTAFKHLNWSFPFNHHKSKVSE